MASILTPIVLDGSVALAWLFADEKSGYADAIAVRAAELEFVVPVLWRLEIANVLVIGERRGRSTPDDTARWTSFLAALPFVVDDETAERAWTDVLALARAQRLTAYDAVYLELALRRGLPLATLDEQLQRAAHSCGVTHFVP